MTKSVRQLSGVVKRKSGDKTIAVEIVSVSQHALYGKKIVKSKRYLVHDPENEAKVGQEVVIEESRPVSKKKRWTLTKSK